MNTRSALVLSAVALLVASGLASADVTGSPDISVQVVDDRVTPGEETTLDVVLLNSGSVDEGSVRNPALNSEVTRARGTTVTVESGDAPFEVTTGTQAVGTVPVGATQPISFGLSVANDAEPGTYEVPVTVEYEYTDSISEENGSQTEETVERTFSVAVTVEEAARLNVTDVDTTTRVGGTGTVTLSVENAGTATANDATVTLNSPSSDLTLGQSASANRFVDTWEPGEERTFEYRVTATRSAETERYPFTLSAEYELDDGRDRTTAPTNVPVEPKPEQTFTVVATDSDVSVGDSGTYTVTLRNDGTSPLEDASVQLTSRNADVTFGQSNAASQFVGHWEPGAERTVTFDANVGENADKRNYTLDATVNYERPDGTAGQTNGISLALRPSSEQSFAIEDVESSLQVGDDGQLTGVVTNTGDRRVSNVVVEWVSEQRNVDPVETEYAIGELAPGESSEFDFTVDVGDSARSGPRQFTLQTRYRTDEGDQRTGEELDVQADVASESDEFDVLIENANVTAGEGSTISVQITNAEDETLSDVSAKIFADSPISANDDEAFVSSLEPGESANLTFSISAGGSALQKNYPVSMDFQYDESDGDTVTSDTYKIPVAVQRESGGGVSTLVIVGVVVLLVALAAGGYLLFR